MPTIRNVVTISTLHKAEVIVIYIEIRFSKHRYIFINLYNNNFVKDICIKKKIKKIKTIYPKL